MKSKALFFVIAHNIRSLQNVGSIFRTADAFGVRKIFLTGYTGTPDHPIHGQKLKKVSLGAENFVPWEYNKSVKRVLKDLTSKISAKGGSVFNGKDLRLKHPKITVVALENNVGADLGYPIALVKFKPKFPLALILGEEVKGIKKDVLKLCDKIVEIPMRGQKESLNVSVAFGVAAYEISKYII